MLLIRSILFNISFLLVSALYSLLAVLFLPMPRRVLVKVAGWWGGAVVFLMRVIVGTRLEVEGRGNIPSDGHFIIAAKHQSVWETVALPYIFKGQLVFMFKKELLYIPFFGLVLWKSGCIPVDRGATTKSGLRKIIARFKEVLKKSNIGIFPEGTRTLPGAAPAYKSGIGMIVSSIGGTRIVPIALNSGLYWPKKGALRYPGKIRVKILPSFDSTGMNREEILKRVEDAIEGGMKSLQGS